MTHEQFYTAVSEIANYTDRDAYISDLSLSSIFEGTSDPLDSAESLSAVWDAFHMNIKDLRTITGLSQAAFSRRFLIPRRTVENWESPGANHTECPLYTRMMISDLLGLLPDRTDD